MRAQADLTGGKSGSRRLRGKVVLVHSRHHILHSLPITGTCPSRSDQGHSTFILVLVAARTSRSSQGGHDWLGGTRQRRLLRWGEVLEFINGFKMGSR